MIRVAQDLAAFETTLLRRMSEEAPAGAVNLGLGQPDVDPAPELVEALRLGASGAAHYSANAGLPALRQAIAARYDADPDEVVVTVGAAEALFLALCGTLEPGDRCLVPEPGYPAYGMICAWRGVEVVPYPLDRHRGFALNVDAVLDRVTRRTRLVVVNSPGNPTGAVHDGDSLARLCDALETLDIPILSDEVYASLDFRGPDAPPLALPSALSRQALVASSLSKSHGLMGWRLGWLLAPREVARGLMPLQQMVATCAPVPAQHAAIVALGESGRAAAEAVTRELAERRALALAAVARLPEIPAPVSEGALYLFLDVSRYLDGDDVALARRLLQYGVITVPGRAFGAAGRGHLRVSYGARREDLVTGFERLQRGLEACL